MSTIITVTNQKGGVGKTTTAVNLGAYLAKSGKSVLIADLDPQGNATSGLGIAKHELPLTMYHGMLDHTHASKIVLKTNIPDLFILPANKDLAAAEVELVNQQGREFRLKQLLSNYDADYIIIDSPPSLGLLTINALTAADYILIPVQAEYYALEGLSQLLDTVQRVRQALNPNLDLLGVLITMYDPRTSLAPQVHKEVNNHFKGKVFDVVVPRNVRLAEAPSHGKPISEHDRWSKGARSYKQLAKEVEKRVKGTR